MKPATPYIIEADQYGRWVMRCAVLAHSSSEAVRLMSYLPYDRIRAITATRAREKDLREVNRLLDAAGLRVTNFDPAPQNNTEARQLAAEPDEPQPETQPSMTAILDAGNAPVRRILAGGQISFF